jgi:hypothetical protein
MCSIVEAKTFSTAFPAAHFAWGVEVAYRQAIFIRVHPPAKPVGQIVDSSNKDVLMSTNSYPLRVGRMLVVSINII